jgi:hypothetical protein
MVFSKNVIIVLKINIKAQGWMQKITRGYESTTGEEERGSKGLRNNPKLLKLPKFLNLHLFTMCLIKNFENQS